MNVYWQSLLTIAIASSLITSTSEPTLAQVSCEDPEVIKELPKNCQRERISASGNQRPTRLWALGSARDHWQDQALTKYGERYARWRRAACLKEECIPSSLGGFKRCTLSGFPCITKPVLQNVTELTMAELKEMQRRLNRAGILPRLKVDGKFGPKTSLAIERWQRRNGYPIDGMASRKNLKRLRG